MKKITIPGTDIEVSKFVFGTAGLLNAGGTNARLRLLQAAVANGFTHFDVAPYYGFGFAERDLAPILKEHSHLTVTSKVGLYSPGGENQSAISVLARKVAGKVLKSLSKPISSFELKKAQLSLEASLTRLGREHIDFYLLHEPQLSKIDTPVWVDWLESRKREGKIRAFGIASFAHQVTPFLDNNSPLASIVQVSDSVEKHEADIVLKHKRPLQFTFGYLAAARGSKNNLPAIEILREAMNRNQTGAIIVSTKRTDRLAMYRDL